MTNINTLSKVSAYFTHSTTLYLFLTALGAFEDQVPLRADNYSQQKYRKFRSSKMIPYGANFAAIRYQCTGTNQRDNIEKVLFLQNQIPLVMPWCKNRNGICSVSEIIMYINSPMCSCDISPQISNAHQIKISISIFLFVMHVHFLRLHVLIL